MGNLVREYSNKQNFILKKLCKILEMILKLIVVHGYHLFFTGKVVYTSVVLNLNNYLNKVVEL